MTKFLSKVILEAKREKWETVKISFESLVEHSQKERKKENQTKERALWTLDFGLKSISHPGKERFVLVL